MSNCSSQYGQVLKDDLQVCLDFIDNREKLEKIIDRELEGVSQQVKLTLPKLKKKDSSSQKSTEIKLPKLKKV